MGLAASKPYLPLTPNSECLLNAAREAVAVRGMYCGERERTQNVL